MQTFTDLYKYRFILARLVDKDLKAQYRNMSLGFLWALLNPLVLVTVLSLVWTLVFVNSNIKSFPSYVLVTLIPYNFFAYCLNACTGSLHNNVTLVKKIRFPRQILPFSAIVTHSIHYVIQCSLVLVALLIFPPAGDIFGLPLLWLPLILVIQVGFVIGLGLLVASLTVFYRDVQYIVESTLTVLFWFSPILYSSSRQFLAKPDPASTMPTQEHLENQAWAIGQNLGKLADRHPELQDTVQQFQDASQKVLAATGKLPEPLTSIAASGPEQQLGYYLYHLNPISGILESYRCVLYWGEHPPLFPLGVSAVLTVLVGYIGVKTFWRRERDFADMM